MKTEKAPTGKDDQALKLDLQKAEGLPLNLIRLH